MLRSSGASSSTSSSTHKLCAQPMDAELRLELAGPGLVALTAATGDRTSLAAVTRSTGAASLDGADWDQRLEAGSEVESGQAAGALNLAAAAAGRGTAEPGCGILEGSERRRQRNGRLNCHPNQRNHDRLS